MSNLAKLLSCCIAVCALTCAMPADARTAKKSDAVTFQTKMRALIIRVQTESGVGAQLLEKRHLPNASLLMRAIGCLAASSMPLVVTSESELAEHAVAWRVVVGNMQRLKTDLELSDEDRAVAAASAGQCITS